DPAAKRAELFHLIRRGSVLDPDVTLHVAPQQGVTESRSHGARRNEPVKQLLEVSIIFPHRPGRLFTSRNRQVRMHRDVRQHLGPELCLQKWALCRNLEKWPIGGDLKFWPRRLVVEVGLPGCKPESSGDERREMVWKWGRAWCVPARSVVSTPRRRC